jgi:8-oxo-dGTP pyrophosphatase MutT (NUDIX family)
MEDRNSAVQTRQVAALVFRVSEQEGVEVLLMTSRGTGRAVIPKGWAMKGKLDHEAAAQETYEEAGILGKIARKPIGTYEYWKELATTCELVSVDVYPLEVERQRKKWPEQGSREVAWFTRGDAALRVNEPALAAMILGFVASSH